MSSACLACHCAISMPLTGMRTIGVTGGTSPALAICARLSMYCRQSRSLPESHGLCSISNTQPSYLDALRAMAESTWAGAKHVSACCPPSSALITLFRRGGSGICPSLLDASGILDDLTRRWKCRRARAAPMADGSGCAPRAAGSCSNQRHQDNERNGSDQQGATDRPGEKDRRVASRQQPGLSGALFELVAEDIRNHQHRPVPAEHLAGNAEEPERQNQTDVPRVPAKRDCQVAGRGDG